MVVYKLHNNLLFQVTCGINLMLTQVALANDENVKGGKQI